jgi:mRNA-degrading endonuclease RelE of RelBE toxin-antitoxin system
MSFRIVALPFFKTQVACLDKKAKRLIYDKIQLVKENPFRYKRIHSKQYSRVFRIRLTIQRKETRLVYVVMEPKVILVCLFDQKSDYKKLEHYLDNIKKET